MSKEILINQLFAGNYLEEEENIGHEIINIFKDDKGNNNLFITPDGYIDINRHDIECILFVRNEKAKRTVEVIGMAQNFKYFDDNNKNDEKEINTITYANVSLNQIFSNNKYRGEKDKLTHNVTLRAEKFILPSRRLFLTIDEDYCIDESDDRKLIKLNSKKKVIISQAMRSYYSEKEDISAYNQLRDIINDSELWKDENTTDKLFPDGAVQSYSPTFMEVIRKEDDENVFSNLLAYFFEYSHTSFRKFAKELLNIPDMSAFFQVKRETPNRVDLWIESEKHIIVIENKIKSGINGVVGDDFSQLDKYIKTAKEEAKKTNKEPHFFIFAPDYSRIDMKKYNSNEDYTVVRYSGIYKFFVNEAEIYIADRVFSDFLRGLKRHTLSYSELQFDIMRSRLLRKINTFN